MKIQKEFRKLENIEEINIYDVNEKEFYTPTPQEFDVEKIPVQRLMNNVPLDVHILLPYDDANDFIIQGLGNKTLKRGDFKQSDVEGRRLSKISPMFYELLAEYLRQAYHTHEIKKIRFQYYTKDNIQRLTDAKIIYDADRIFVITEHIDKARSGEKFNKPGENIDNLMEFFSQTGSYYKVNGKYTYTQGIYYIIDRARDEYDEYYNIIFDMVIAEDKALVKDLQKDIDTKKHHHNEIIRIRTPDGSIKRLEITVQSNFNENDELESHYGIVRDISNDSKDKSINPIDYLLNGFKNSKKLALMLEPLNTQHYGFSQGFYHLIEKKPEEYHHSRDVIKNIKEDKTRQNIIKIADGELNEIYETFTYYVDGDENRQKICDLYIECFKVGNETHSIGFITDTTEEMKKQQELIKANEHQIVLIKEVHHRVKNNLQILNSFLRLEKRVYKDNPNIIIDHMQSRLNSLALLHEKTYNTEDFKNINLKDYLTDQDLQYKTLFTSKAGIQILSEIDETLNLSIEVLTPLSLIIDELTMNAIKHAFTDDMKNKQITKKISRIDDNRARLIIKDNGVGIEDVGKITKNLGCEIIKSLTKQLDGEIKLLKLEKGTGYELIFPVTMKHTITQG